MLSLTDLRSNAVALDWHEAVAVAAALGTLLAEAGATACPRLADVMLLPSGELRVSGPGLIDAPLAAGVAQVLAELLESAPCPAELRQLIDRHADASRGRPDEDADAVADLVTGLAFFERPGRGEVLAALERRAASALEHDRRTAALGALTARTRLAAGPSSPAGTAPVADSAGGAEETAETSGWDPPRNGGISPLIVAAAVSLVAFVVVVIVATTWFDRSAPVTTRAEVADEELPMSGPRLSEAPARQARPPRTNPTAAPAAPAAAGRSSPDVPGDGRSPAAAAPSSPPAAPVPGTLPSVPSRTVDVVVAERDGRVLPSPVASTPRTPPPGRVFQAGDADVKPAILIRPQLPESPPPDVPEEQIGTLEFVVAESGAVEHVHLISPANRYQERMLVAAAKTWQFQPATRAGRPVRFRTRIRVTL